MRDEGTVNESHLWILFEDFVTNFNEYRIQLFFPLDLICYDESI